MPSEVIRNRPEVDDGALPYTRVGWGRDAQYVQLGTVIPESEGKIQHRNTNPDNPNLWEDVDCPQGEAGWFVQLDRDGCNRLIRTLRRARDQAFGADA
jgi:hypothetical protein